MGSRQWFSKWRKDAREKEEQPGSDAPGAGEAPAGKASGKAPPPAASPARPGREPRVTGDAGPRASFLRSFFGPKEEETPHALGEYDAKTYPQGLADLLRRRQEVMDELMELDLTSTAGREVAIPRLQELLHKYPHPLAYEALINAFVDGGRWDEARGVAFAARERRFEVAHSPFPEIRMEIDRLNEWTPEEIDVLRAEREGRIIPTQPIRN